jgi:hypothetical protein
LLNLPEKNARRDITHGVKHLEEIAEGWLCARRTLGILSVLAERWKVELPEEAATVLARTDAKFGRYDETGSKKVDSETPKAERVIGQIDTTSAPPFPAYSMPMSAATPTSSFFDNQDIRLGSISGGAGAQPPHRGSEARSLPPNDASAMTYARGQHDAATPASTITATGNQSNSTGNSPSQFFGGTDQPMPEAQDWWLRDQNQIAAGFENWVSRDDMSWYNGVSQGSPAVGPVASTASQFAVSPIAQGVDMGVGTAPIQSNVQNNNVNAMNGIPGYGAALNSYNEQEWYQLM